MKNRGYDLDADQGRLALTIFIVLLVTFILGIREDKCQSTNIVAVAEGTLVSVRIKNLPDVFAYTNRREATLFFEEENSYSIEYNTTKSQLNTSALRVGKINSIVCLKEAGQARHCAYHVITETKKPPQPLFLPKPLS